MSARIFGTLQLRNALSCSLLIVGGCLVGSLIGGFAPSAYADVDRTEACADDKSSPCDVAGIEHQVCDVEREAQARRLIESARQFMQTAREHHKTTELLIAEAKKLKGQARILEKKNVAPPAKRLSPAEYKAALQQFDQDINLFKQHASAYSQHLDSFRRQVGECSSNQARYEEQAREYTLHTNRYHVPNVPPPHICVDLNMTESEARTVANTYRSDRERLVRAETELREQENLLKRAEQASSKADDVAVKQSERAQKEKEIAGEFAKLKQEYELIEIERKSLDNSGVKHKYTEAKTKVSGSVKQK